MHSFFEASQVSTSSVATTVSVATSLTEVEALREVWSTFAITDIDADIDYFMTVVGADNHIKPHVMLIRRQNASDLMVVARVQTVSMPLRIGYRVFGRVSLRALIVSFDGILGTRNRTDEDLVFDFLRRALKAGTADIVHMRNIDVGSDRYAAAVSSTPRLLRGCGQPASHRWVADIPRSYDEFLNNRSPKTRSKMRGHDRALRKCYESNLQLRVFTRPETLPDLCSDMMKVASLSYQRGLGVGFSRSPVEIALIKLGLKKGWHRTWILYLNEQPVAFWTGIAYRNVFLVDTPGFDPKFGKESVGRFTMLRMVEDLCRETEISCLDFGQGEAEYKSAFGRAIRLEREVLLTAARPLPILLMTTYSLFCVVNNQARGLVGKSNWVRRLKTFWRRSKAPVATDQSGS